MDSPRGALCPASSRRMPPGPCRFRIGSGVHAAQKVFAATEASVLSRNPNVDPTTKDLIAYFQRCIQSKQADINLGFISA